MDYLDRSDLDSKIQNPSLFTDEQVLAMKLRSSLEEFIKLFYWLRNNRTFDIPDVPCRKSHIKIIIEELTDLFLLKRITKDHMTDLMINTFPGSFKSTLCVYFVAWTYAHYHDCQYIYVSFTESLAETHTAEIKAIMSIPLYNKLFNVCIDPKSKARGDFRVFHRIRGGSGRCTARGSEAAITGLNGGMPNAIDFKTNQLRWSGCVLIDDIHNPTNIRSDTTRDNVKFIYNNTIKTRCRSMYIPILMICQRLDMDDVPQMILDGKDGRYWRCVILKSLDAAGNPMAPWIWSKEKLLEEEAYNRYTFYAQHQQSPVSATGGIFLRDEFKITEEDPDCYFTFITADTAESTKSWADYTAFSFWGVYKIKISGVDTGKVGLHLIKSIMIKIEPRELRDNFLEFYADCIRYKTPVRVAFIEQKSTGGTLLSLLQEIPGIEAVPIKRDNLSSKADRFLRCQQYVARGYVSLTRNSPHENLFLDHISKITPNSSQKHDDLADTLSDAIHAVYIEKTIDGFVDTLNYDQIAQQFAINQQTSIYQNRFR